MIRKLSIPEFPSLQAAATPSLTGIYDWMKTVQELLNKAQRRIGLERAIPDPPRSSRDAAGVERRRENYDQELQRALKESLQDIINQLNSQVQGTGADIVAAENIRVTNAIHHVTGSATIRTIELPFEQIGMASISSITRNRKQTGFTGPIWLVSQGGFSLGTGGNISAAKTTSPGDCVNLVYCGQQWHPVR